MKLRACAQMYVFLLEHSLFKVLFAVTGMLMLTSLVKNI